MSNLTVNTDGGARGNPGPAAIGVVIQDDGKIIHEHKAYLGEQTNNVAEYEALLYALGWVSRFCVDKNVDSVEFLLDSKLVVEQVQGHWKVKEAHLQTLVSKAKELLVSLPCSYAFRYVPRAQNAHADKLVNQALDEVS
jgi:ribonuclease HI